MGARDERTDRRREAEARAHLFRARRLAQGEAAPDRAAPPAEPCGYAGADGNEVSGSASPAVRATQRTPASR
jgi:hypothetical protein